MTCNLISLLSFFILKPKSVPKRQLIIYYFPILRNKLPSSCRSSCLSRPWFLMYQAPPPWIWKTGYYLGQGQFYNFDLIYLLCLSILNNHSFVEVLEFISEITDFYRTYINWLFIWGYCHSWFQCTHYGQFMNLHSFFRYLFLTSHSEYHKISFFFCLIMTSFKFFFRWCVIDINLVNSSTTALQLSWLGSTLRASFLSLETNSYSQPNHRV